MSDTDIIQPILSKYYGALSHVKTEDVAKQISDALQQSQGVDEPKIVFRYSRIFTHSNLEPLQLQLPEGYCINQEALKSKPEPYDPRIDSPQEGK